MVSVTNHEVHSECECCQPRPASELARLRRINRRLLANRKELIEQLKLAHKQIRKLTADRAWARLQLPYPAKPKEVYTSIIREELT